MFKVFLLSLFAICSALDVLEVSGPKVVKTSQTHLPLRSVSGAFSTLPGLSQVRSPLSLHLGGLRSYGLNTVGYNTLGLNNVGLNTVGVNTVNVSPSLYSYLPYQTHQHALQRLAVPQVHTVQVEQPSVYTVARPALSLGHQALTYAQPQLSVAAIRPQVLTNQQSVHPVNAAIHQVGRTVEYRTVPYNDQPIVPQDIVVEPSDQPINIHFKSRSSTVRLSQEHIPGEPGSVEQTQSQDEPSKVVHEVVKPVIQEVREVIQPYRQLTQEVQPVVENVHTVVSQGEGVRQQYVAEQVKPVQVQQVAVQPIQVQQPVQQLLRVAQPVQQVVRVAQPVQHLQVEPVQHAVQVQHVQPQYQAVHVEARPVQVAQIDAQPINYQTIQFAQQPLNFRTVGVAQQVVGPQVTRLTAPQPHIAIRNVREQVVAREVVPNKQIGTDFVKFAESD